MNFVEAFDFIADFYVVFIFTLVLIAITVGWVKKCFTEDLDVLGEASEQEKKNDNNIT